MNPANSDPAQYVQQLEMQLQDAQLVIGRQQLQILRMEQAIRNLQQQVQEASQPSADQDQAPLSGGGSSPSRAKT